MVKKYLVKIKVRYLLNPKIKCCTYIPEVHNYLVARILLEKDAATVPGSDLLLNRIQKKVNVTPLGVGRSKVFSLLYEHSSNSILNRLKKTHKKTI